MSDMFWSPSPASTAHTQHPLNKNNIHIKERDDQDYLMWSHVPDNFLVPTINNEWFIAGNMQIFHTLNQVPHLEKKGHIQDLLNFILKVPY